MGLQLFNWSRFIQRIFLSSVAEVALQQYFEAFRFLAHHAVSISGKEGNSSRLEGAGTVLGHINPAQCIILFDEKETSSSINAFSNTN